MRKIFLTAWVIAFLAATANGDRLILTDGREFEGVVTVEVDSVLIVMEYARLRFPKDQVLRIELKDLPKVELQNRLARVGENDPDALFEVAEWAIEAGLHKEAEKIIADVLELEGDHAAARAELQHVKIDEDWHPLDKAIELARSKMEAGQFELLLSEVLPDLEKVATRREEILTVREMVGRTQLRAKKFTAATRTFANLAEQTTGKRSILYSAITGILRANADGMYVLLEAYPPQSHLLGRTEPVLEAGPASLAEPLVLQAALRDHAKKEIQAGQELMAEARELESSKPPLAHVKYQQALGVFERADALVPDIARSYRVEVIRRRIAIIRKACDAEARKFDAAVAALGKKPITPRAYREKIIEMIRRVENIRDPLKEILVLAKPYPRELFLEVQWAESDLRRVNDIRNILVETLNGRG
ncbi:MAG: hypothetical protein ACYTF6_05040 [Planctomycetota bacterium]